MNERKLAFNTVYNYDQYLTNYGLFLSGKVKSLEEIKPRYLIQWFADMLISKKVKPQTILVRMSMTRKFHEYLENKGIVGFNPSNGIRLVKVDDNGSSIHKIEVNHG